MGRIYHANVDGSQPHPCRTIVERFVIVVTVYALCYALTLAVRSGHQQRIRDDVNNSSQCPSPLLDFPTSGADESGTVFDRSFATKRKYGSWHATVELGIETSAGFQPAGPSLVVDGCTWMSPWIKNRYILILDRNGRLLGSVDSDPFSWGWKLKIFDCAGNLRYTVEERRGMIRGADLTIYDGSSQTRLATSTYDWELFGTKTMTVHATNGSSAVLGRATRQAIQLGTREYRLFAQEGGAVEPIVLSVIAAYKTWADKSCGKNCRGDFNGTCEATIQVAELLLLAVLAGACYCGFRLFRRKRTRPRSRTVELSGFQKGTAEKTLSPGRIKNPMHMSPRNGDIEEGVSRVEGMYAGPIASVPKGLQLPPTVSHDSV